jgi:hypothetical protein
VIEPDVTSRAFQAFWVMLFLASTRHIGRLHVQAFNAFATRSTQRIFQLVVMMRTIWVITVDVEFGSWKCRLACVTNKTLFVVPAREQTISACYRLLWHQYKFRAATTDALVWNYPFELGIYGDH